LKYYPRTQSRDRENELALTCNFGCCPPIPDAGCLYFLMKIKLVSVCGKFAVFQQ
jgi:hypothetical protein